MQNCMGEGVGVVLEIGDLRSVESRENLKLSLGRKGERACALIRNIEGSLGSFMHLVEVDD